MKFFTNKKIWEKVILALIFVLLFQFAVMKPVEADVLEAGGKLITPIMSFVVSIGDGIMSILHKAVMGTSTELFGIDLTDSAWQTFAAWVVGIAAAIATIAVIVFTAGAAAAVAGAVLGITATATFGVGTVVAAAGVGLVAGVYYSNTHFPDSLYLPVYSYSAENIFEGNILLFNVNFFDEDKDIYALTSNGKSIKVSDYDHYEDDTELEKEITNQGGLEYYYYENNNGEKVITSRQDSAKMIKGTISSWYSAIRNICLVLMLSILVYIGIRMLLSSVASDRAKYLTMLKDWFIGLCLLFLMHYIMAFSVAIVDKITDVVKTSVDKNIYTNVLQDDKNHKLSKAMTELGKEELIFDENGNTADSSSYNGKPAYVHWPSNLMGFLRVEMQMNLKEEQSSSITNTSFGYVGLAICFIILVLFTLYFTVTYFKRFLHMAFLTLIAPLVAFTYCIDKINDGSAQGFNKWFKEYIFNLLIQPMHLLLYYILVTSAFDLAGKNVIYSIVAIGFMIPAEKLLRSLFGFEKAQTAPGMSTAGALMASTALNSLLRKGPKGKGSNGNTKGGDGSDSGSDNVPMPRESGNPMDAFAGERTSGQEQLGSGDSSGDGSGANFGDNGEQRDTVLDRYNAEGFGQNAEGQYFNPWTDEYDENYDPHNDASYMQQEETGNNEPIDGIDVPRTIEPPEQQGEGQSEQPQSTEQPEQKESTRMQRMKRRALRNLNASWAAQKASMRQVPNKFKRKLENAHPMRTMGRIAAGAALGTAAGAAGIAIAASTGELDNIAKIGLGSSAAGYALGSGGARSIKSPMDDPKVQKIHDDAYNKGEKGKYKQDAMDDYVRRYMKDAETISYFEQKFGAAEAKEMLKKGGEVEEYLYNDINDKKEMAAIHKLLNDKKTEVKVNSIEEAIAISQLSQMIGSNTNNMTGKKRREWTERLEEMAGKSGVKDTKRFAQNRLKQIDRLHDFKK